MEGADLLASAQRYDFSGTIDRQRVSICGIGAVCTDPARHDGCHARVLVERLIDDARRDGADLALLFITTDRTCYAPESFEVIPTVDVELKVAESSRYGAPMTLVQWRGPRSGGDRRDGSGRASQFRFHLDRDVDLVKYVITKKRLLAGWDPPVFASSNSSSLKKASRPPPTWSSASSTARGRLKNAATVTLAHVSAPSLQALIAREPVEQRPIIRGWLPPGFVPPRSRSYRRGLRQR